MSHGPDAEGEGVGVGVGEGGILDDLARQTPVLRMAHDIARQFEPWPDKDRAAEVMATHIKKFWEPRMRRELLAHVRLGDTSLDPLVVSAAGYLVDNEVDDYEMTLPSGG